MNVNAVMEIKKEPLETHYDLHEDIGKGQFATVKRCIHKESQAEYAAKFIRKRRGAGRRGAKMEDIQKEMDILSSVSHRNIIRLYDVYETNREVILILELVSGGELFEYISEKDKLSEEEASAFIKQILDGVQHLHSKSIAHLDLKPENILLQDKNSTYVKLIDFGLSRKILPNEDNRAMMGTAEFVAPEVVSYEQLTLATDMWSIGVITYILLSGASPFLGDNQQETYHNITAVNYEFDEDYFNGTSEMAKGFIRSLLVKDRRKRATIHDCLNHPWIKPVEKKQRDLRRSSIIKTEHLKKFIARQRWKRSMRVVSLCNRLSRSIQLRRIQSTDTLGSCSEETKVRLSLSDPTVYPSADVPEGASSDESPVSVFPALDNTLAMAIAKSIVEDVIDKSLGQLNGDPTDGKDVLQKDPVESDVADTNGYSKVVEVVPEPSDSGLNQGDGLSVVESSESYAAETNGYNRVIEVIFDPSDTKEGDTPTVVESVNHPDNEVFAEPTKDALLRTGLLKVDEDQSLKMSTSTAVRRPSRSKRKLSDLQDIVEEDIPLGNHVLDGLIHDVILNNNEAVMNEGTAVTAGYQGETDLSTDKLKSDLLFAEGAGVSNCNDRLCDIDQAASVDYQHTHTTEPQVTAAEGTTNYTEVGPAQPKTKMPDLPETEIISKLISSIIERAKLELVKDRDVGNVVQQGHSLERDGPPDIVTDPDEETENVAMRKTDSGETPEYRFDPLRVVSFTVSWDVHHTVRDLFDIPEELDEDMSDDTGELTESISDELRKKLTRQRLRKMSLQRRVQAKFVKVTAFNQMTRFRKHRNEKRIESFEMTLLKH